MNHKKIIIFLFLFPVLLFSCKSAKTVESDTTKFSNSLLWKIEGEQLNSPSYLYGTIHLIDSEDYFLPVAFEKAFNDAENIVFEIDMNELDDMGQLMSLLPKMMMADDKSLKDLLSEEDYNFVDDFFQKKGLPLFFMEKIKPLLLSVFAEADVTPEAFQGGEFKSYEFEFQKMAQENNKTVMGLETIDYQISIFDSIPYKDQADMLITSLKSKNDDASQMDQFVKLYKEQNINELYAATKTEDYSRFEDILLNNRNRNWIPIMEGMMKEKSSLFAVGAGHLGGKKGVLNLLKKAGYTITPL